LPNTRVLLLASVRLLIARPARNWETRCSSEGGIRSVRDAGRLSGSLRSPRVTRRAINGHIHLPVEGWADARIG